MTNNRTKREPDPVVEAYKKDLDLTLLAETRKLTVSQRFDRLMEMQRLAEELQRAMREAKKKQRDAAACRNE